MFVEKVESVIEYTCMSVVGGWQTYQISAKKLIGPSFHKIQDLWAWQKANLY